MFDKVQYQKGKSHAKVSDPERVLQVLETWGPISHNFISASGCPFGRDLGH